MKRAQRGLSLVEALVALAVMAFGVLGVAGIQATLRQNADIAKQRAEAVRIAQEAIESWRAYTVLPATSGQTAFADIVDTEAETVSGYTTNTSYTLTRTVVDAQAGDATQPPRRSLQVEVTWLDRGGTAQGVRLLTQIAGSPPELAAARGTPANAAVTQRPRGRNPVIPPGAIDQEGGDTSVFEPPGTSGVSWTFDNTTGVITRICNPDCTDANALLLWGYVNFATGSSAPTAADGETPASTSQTLSVVVDMTSPASPAQVDCFTDQRSLFVVYYCAMPLTTGDVPSWSGRSRIVMDDIASTLADANSSRFKVCRYTPVTGCDPTVGSFIWGFPGAVAACAAPSPQTVPATPSRRMANADHPLDYAGVTASLANQNFLVTRAGDGSSAFACPGDDPLTTYSNTNTWRHQPRS